VASEQLSIGELATAAGLTRRAVRFYVQQKLLPPPAGLGRGKHYDSTHLNRLREIGELQQAGHSLDAIRRLLNGETVDPPPKYPAAPRKRAAMSAELWTRIALVDGVELHFDANRHSPSVESLIELRDKARQAFTQRADERSEP
jgi:DNA-binding transcriptional MerR regulator